MHKNITQNTNARSTRGKLATLKSSTCLNLYLLRKEHDESINAARDNCTTETSEKLEKLRQTLEDKKGYVMEIG